MHLEPAQNFINGSWTPALAGQTMPVYEPATGQPFAAIADSTSQDVDLAVRAARKAFDEGSWGKTTAVDRGRIDVRFERRTGLAPRLPRAIELVVERKRTGAADHR